MVGLIGSCLDLGKDLGFMPCIDAGFKGSDSAGCFVKRVFMF